MICSNCGGEISDRAVICRYCGKLTRPVSARGTGAAPRQSDWHTTERGAGTDWHTTERGAGTDWHTTERGAGTDWHTAERGAETDWYAAGRTERAATYTGPDLDVPRRKSRGLLVGVLIAVVVLAAAAVLLGLHADPVAPSADADAPDAVIDAYCEAFSADDEHAIFRLFSPAHHVYFDDSYDDDSEALFLSVCDDWYDYYGTELVRWGLVSMTDYTGAEFDGVASRLGVTIDRAVDATVDVWGEDMEESIVFDFDLVLIDGAWYLYRVW